MLQVIKKSIPAFVFFVFVTSISNAQNVTAYDQLVALNNEWKNQPDVDPALKSKAAIPLNEKELVRFHLQQTEKLLRNRDAFQLTSLQKKNRESNLDVLHRYWQNGVFPINQSYNGRQPIFIDGFNTYCAVGYLMKESGAEAVAKEIQHTQNYSYLADIDHPKLMEWVNNSGLDFGELALIQPGYGGEWPSTITEMHYNNTGTDVNEYIEVHQSNGGLMGMAAFNTIEFYDHADVLYKTLPIANMSSFISNNNQFFYYQFPANESFADSGKIIIKRTAFPGNIVIFTYNASGITMEDFYNMGNPTVRQFAMREDENTAVGSSLVFCGVYATTWDLTPKTATPGSLDICTAGALPISLSDFNYSLNDKAVQLKWQTVSEHNNKFFDIERSSDGIHFNAIGRIPGAINSNGRKDYNFTDANPGYINHYRLKQVDVNDHTVYSKVLFVKCPGANSLILAGNIVQSNLDVRINSDETVTGTLIIYDFSGRQMLKLKAQNGQQHINVSNLDCGKYLIRLYTTDGKVLSQQFVKGS